MSRPHYITKETRQSMSRKEQDLVKFTREKRYTKEQIKRKLYITSDRRLLQLRKQVSEKISLCSQTPLQ